MKIISVHDCSKAWQSDHKMLEVLGAVRLATCGLYVKRFRSGTEINECCCGITGRVFC